MEREERKKKIVISIPVLFFPRFCLSYFATCQNPGSKITLLVRDSKTLGKKFLLNEGQVKKFSITSHFSAGETEKKHENIF